MNVKNLQRGVMLMLCLAIFTSWAFAQTKTITGKVTDSKDGSGISGASVLATGGTAKAGTQTANDGSFKLVCPESTTKLVITSLGYQKIEVSLNGQSSIKVSLVATSDNLNEIVVIGYGTRKVKDLTGSVSTISSKDFNKGVISSPQELFQGRTPGVSITPSSGEPGAALSVNIRGTSSIYNSEPLYIVDGVPVYGGGSTNNANSGVEGSSTAKNPLIFLNPNDIESVTILKDASSTAIYGAAGANGVVLITTKGGRGAKGQLTLGLSTSVSTIAKRYDLLNAQDFLLAVKKANIDAGTNPADAAAAILAIDKGYNTDWQDQILQTGISQNVNLGWGIAKKSTSLRLSGSYDNQKGIVKNSSLQRITLRANFSQKFFNDKLKLDENISYANIKNQYPPNSNNAGYQGSLIGAAITFNPTYPVKNSDGSFFDPLDGNRNPAEMLAYFDSKDNINRVINNTSLSYTLAKGLVYKFTFGYDASMSLRKNFADPRLSSNAFGGTFSLGSHNYNNPINGNGRAVYANYKYNSTLIDHLITYDKTFKNGHQLNAFVGFHYQSFNNYYWNDMAWGLKNAVVAPTDVFIKDINNFTTRSMTFGDTTKGTEQSFFGKINYIINDKYYFTGSVRTDGDSRFGTNNKYGTFPSIAFKWRISNENFAKNTIDKIFNDLSVRVSYGVSGSKSSLPIYGSLAVKQVYIFGPGDTSVSYLTNANPNLKWESTANSVIGVDFSLFNGRLKGSVDYYHKNTQNLIFYNYFLPRSSNPWRWENLNAKVINKGFDVSLDFQALTGRKKNSLGWEIIYNMSFNNNTVKDLPIPINTGQVNGQGLSGAYAQQIINGYSLFEWKMPVFLGFNGNGDARYANGSNDQLVGSPLPTFTAGLTNNFVLGNWNASIFLNSSRGFYVYNNTANALFLKGSVKTAHNITYAVANSPEDPINPGSVSTRFLEKGDFIRLSNVALGYTFRIRKGDIKSLNVSLSGQNLLLITKYSGLDPEINVDHGLNGVPSRGFDYAGYPKARTFTLGLNVGF